MTNMESIMRSSVLCSILGHRILCGDTEALKALYRNIWTEHPAIIKTVNQLQVYLTSVEIEDDTKNLYDAEFLYYWGMLCLGEQSHLIGLEPEIAETCFQKIKGSVPQVEARMVYIKLLLSDEPIKSDSHARWLDVLRQHASWQGDLFSMVALAKICFQSYLSACQENDADLSEAGLPQKVLKLLTWPCQMGHPVAIRFWNEMCSYLGHPESILNIERINSTALYDFKMSANMQIGL